MDETEEMEDAVELDEEEGEEEEEAGGDELADWMSELAVELDRRGKADIAEIVRGLIARL